MTDRWDRSDPGDRAAADVERRRRREHALRMTAALLACGLAAAGPPTAGALLGEGGTVGAVVGAIVLLACAVAIWPQPLSRVEAEHHRLAAIWREARPGTSDDVAWDRFAAWAQADGEQVALLVVRRRGGSTEAGDTGSPSPYSQRVHDHVDGGDAAEATAAMERLRDHVRDLETRARADHEASLSAAERRRHAEALRRLDDDADAELRRREEEMRREVEAAESAERRSDAAAVARALRRP
jgi:hypothetical protein